ncbi:(-)-isopiperitenol/(-)-carveol dehydrogenase, mitochondrial-like [Coffea arabica]|uniref:(-)-isopiperitenol/(-)-carveol dehydrogenase, mitochondrial-like n=1 Tax=Coffea arabica TaxID=13443 RepID=A0A6P6W9T3_COFAR|nr:(-)-isopiperitenol/(-)-carveol dehydrogenase, mitochondrial-like isoform X1 [Coffea arabica]
MAQPPPNITKKLEGKVAIITGGARGIGEATARLFANHGARVVIADIQDEEGQTVAESIGSETCSYVHCDVADEEQVKKLVDSTIHTYGQLDIMFSNAGVFSKSKQLVIDLDFAGLDRIMAINVRGTAACVKHAAKAMVERGVKGSIVCTASLAATTGGESWTDYYMSKHAILGLMRCASKQLGPHGIRVNTVSPFAVATPLTCSSFQMDAEEFEKLNQPLSCLKGTILKVNHIADAALFLASDDSAFITGHNLVVDGGCTV